MNRLDIVEMLIGVASLTLDMSEESTKYVVCEENLALSLTVKAYKTLVLEYVSRCHIEKNEEEDIASNDNNKEEMLTEYSFNKALALITAFDLPMSFPDSLINYLREGRQKLWEEAWSMPFPLLARKEILDFLECTADNLVALQIKDEKLS